MNYDQEIERRAHPENYPRFKINGQIMDPADYLFEMIPELASEKNELARLFIAKELIEALEILILDKQEKMR